MSRRFLSLILTSLSCLIGFGFASPPVKVQLRTSWPAPNVLLEILEVLSVEKTELFFPALDLLSSPDNVSLGSLDARSLYHTSLRLLTENGFLSSPSLSNTLEMSLALHAASPSIEAYYQYYRDHNLEETPLAVEEGIDHCTGSWVLWNNTKVCSAEMLHSLLKTHTGSAGTTEQPQLLSFDHVYPDREADAPIVILYGSVFAPNFRALHDYIYALSKESQPKVRYVFRHAPVSGSDSSPHSLSGYGVFMDLKKMDYLALDDRRQSRSGNNSVTHGKAQAEEPADVDYVSTLTGQLDDSVDLSQPLNQEEIFDIGTKATSLIASAPKPLQALLDVSQNFPKYATTIGRGVTVSPEVLQEIEGNWQKLHLGFSSVWLNGVILQPHDVNVFGLLRLLRKEREIIEDITDLGLTSSQAIDLLTHDSLISTQASSPVLDGLYDASDRREGSAIAWWNDIEKDQRFASWSPSLEQMLRPTFPGQFYPIRQNLYNLVLSFDLSQRSSIFWITGPINGLLQRGYPIRIGIVPMVNTESATQGARLFYYSIDKFGRTKTMELLRKLALSRDHVIDFKSVRAEYEALTAGVDEELLDFDTVIGLNDDNVDLNDTVERARLYTRRLSINPKSAPSGQAFLNGKPVKMSEDFMNHIQMEVNQQMQFLQQKIYFGELRDQHDMSTYFYDLPSTLSKRHHIIHPTDQRGSIKIHSIPELFKKADASMKHSDFVYSSSVSLPSISIWVIADFDTPRGETMLYHALDALDENSVSRISFFHNPSNNTPPHPEALSQRLAYIQSADALDEMTASELSFVLKHPGHGGEFDHILDIIDAGIDDSTFSSFINSRTSRLLRAMDVQPGQHAVLVNGRFLGPLSDDEDLDKEDFQMLAEYEMSKRVGPVQEALANITGIDSSTSYNFSDVIWKLSSVVSGVQIPDPSEEGLYNTAPRPRNRRYLLLDSQHTSFSFGDNETATFQFAFVFDPLTEVASRWTPLIQWLATFDSVYTRVYLNPGRALAELPIKQFYRVNLPHRLEFNEKGDEVEASVYFKNLPPEPIYTLGMDVPQSWLVRPHETHHDLDNIHMASFTGADQIIGVETVFSLDYLVVEGHARDNRNSPPRGLQLQLSTSNFTAVADTQVVANLGYFQFKVKPGVFNLEIREGYGQQIFEIESVGNDGWNSPSLETAGNEITVTSLDGLILYPRFRKRPGMERADVLQEPQEEHSQAGLMDQMVSGLSSFFRSNQEIKEVAPSGQAEINIFTVASGLLYERFASIMILSVLRNTNSTVKFWFIENFLSPSFLEFIPHFAQAYNFQYELVTYKWPAWLREQKEKQRIIWGYKILFLDVLFPMDLKRVIFVDADQIVRADLKELVDLDLQGAPYGYTPMGDDNVEMEGFRFWKTGYWADYLAGKPYHISALYVVDLVRFRQLAAGDRLRGSYQALSADPNSLANLDQDLPNNLQHEVPIFSLPEDWLWCETWCSKDRLDRAKTIDLCQNPLTKEPKLSRARQIPEWEEYDNQVSRFAKSLADEGIIHSDAYTSGADALANIGKTPSSSSSEDLIPEQTMEDDHNKGASDTGKIRDEL